MNIEGILKPRTEKDNITDFRKKELLYMTYFRAIAILFIVAGHTLIFGSGKLSKTLSYYFQGGTSYFVFVAGFLFQYLSYKYNYKDFLKKKFFNVILPYFVTVIPCSIYFAFASLDSKHLFYNIDPIIRFFYAVVFGLVVNGAMWFIGMINIFFITSPLYIAISKKKNLWYSILVLSILITIFIPRMWVNNSFNSAPTIYQIASAHICYFLRMFVYFLSVWLLGMELCKRVENNPEFIKSNKKILICTLGLLYILLYVLLVVVWDVKIQYFGVARLVSTLLGFVLLFSLWEKFAKISILDKVLKFLAKYSFGIFFIHMPIVFYIRNRSIIEPGVHTTIKSQGDILHLIISGCIEFLGGILGSILLLVLIKYLLTKLKVKNTRWFIGV